MHFLFPTDQATFVLTSKDGETTSGTLTPLGRATGQADADWGRYWLEITGLGIEDSVVDVKYKLKPAKASPRKATLPPEARLNSVLPGTESNSMVPLFILIACLL